MKSNLPRYCPSFRSRTATAALRHYERKDRMALIFSTTIFRLPSEPSATPSPATTCQICDLALGLNTLVATVSCCNTTTHAKCHSKWVDKDEGFPTASVLPECPKCRSHFSPAGYYHVMTDIACGDITVEASNGAKEVRKIELVVNPVELQALQYSLYQASRPKDRLPVKSMLYSPRDNQSYKFDD